MCSISLGEALSGYVVFVEQSSVQSVVNRAALAEYGPGMMHLLHTATRMLVKEY